LAGRTRRPFGFRILENNEQWWVHRDALGLLDEDWRPPTSGLAASAYPEHG
jgi:hypothetical protein